MLWVQVPLVALMNYDLQLRLKSQDDLCFEEWAFYWTLVAKFIRMTKCGGRIDIKFEEINTDDDDTAYVTYDGQRFEIVFDPRIPFGMLVDYTIHEFAHIGTWFVNESNDHGPMFGVEFARLYCQYLRLYENTL